MILMKPENKLNLLSAPTAGHTLGPLPHFNLHHTLLQSWKHKRASPTVKCTLNPHLQPNTHTSPLLHWNTHWALHLCKIHTTLTVNTQHFYDQRLTRHSPMLNTCIYTFIISSTTAEHTTDSLAQLKTRQTPKSWPHTRSSYITKHTLEPLLQPNKHWNITHIKGTYQPFLQPNTHTLELLPQHKTENILDSLLKMTLSHTSPGDHGPDVAPAKYFIGLNQALEKYCCSNVMKKWL